MWTDEDIKCIVGYFKDVVGGMPIDDVPMKFRDAVKALIV